MCCIRYPKFFIQSIFFNTIYIRMSHKINQLVLFKFYLWELFQHFIENYRVRSLYNSTIPWHYHHFSEQEYQKYTLRKDETQMASHEWAYFSKSVNHLYLPVHKPLFSSFSSVTPKGPMSRVCFISVSRANKGQTEHNCGLIFPHLNLLA